MSDDADKGSFASDQPGITDLDNFTENIRKLLLRLHYGVDIMQVSRESTMHQRIGSCRNRSTTAKRLRGEVLFIRGYYYFNLVRFFGGVPIVTYVPNGPRAAVSDTTLETRASIADVYNKVIIPDLTIWDGQFTSKGQTPVGQNYQRCSRNLLAKVNMYLKNWQAVRT